MSGTEGSAPDIYIKANNSAEMNIANEKYAERGRK